MRYRFEIGLAMSLVCLTASGCLTLSGGPPRTIGMSSARARPTSRSQTVGGTQMSVVSAASYRPDTPTVVPTTADWPSSPTVPPNSSLALGSVSASGLPLPSSRGDMGIAESAPQVLPSLWEQEIESSRAIGPSQPLANEPLLLSLARCYLENRPQDAVPELAKIDESSRLVLVSLLPLTVRAAEGKISQSSPHEVARFVDGLQSVLGQFRPKAALLMDKYCFCRLIRGFGKIEALDPNPSFLPGEMVDVYLELRNVASRPYQSERGDFRTHLRSQLEIRNPSGQCVWGPQQFDKPDDTLTPQHDYYQHYRFQVPNLPPGNYMLHLEVCDVPTARTVAQGLEFTVAPRGKTSRPE